MTTGPTDLDFALPARAGADVVQDLATRALALIAAADEAGGAPEKLALDAGAVEQIDGGAVVLLANVARTLRARGGALAVSAPTSPFVDAFSDLGLYEDLMKMEFRK